MTVQDIRGSAVDGAAVVGAVLGMDGSVVDESARVSRDGTTKLRHDGVTTSQERAYTGRQNY